MNDQLPAASVTVCSSNQNGMSRVMVEPGAASPRTVTTPTAVVDPSGGSVITNPTAGIVGAGVAMGDERLGVGACVGVGLGLGVGLGVGEGLGVAVGLGVGVGVGLGLGVGLGVGEGVASGLKTGRRLAVGSALDWPTTTLVANSLEVGTGPAGPLRTPDSNSSTTTASKPTATNANQSSLAFERRGRVKVPRGTTPVRRSPSADRGSGRVMGWAGYSRTRKQALNAAVFEGVAHDRPS